MGTSSCLRLGWGSTKKPGKAVFVPGLSGFLLPSGPRWDCSSRSSGFRISRFVAPSRPGFPLASGILRQPSPITAAGPRWICTIFPIERRPKWAAFCTVAALIKDCSMEMIPPRPRLCQTKYHQGGAKHLSSLRAPPLPPPGASSTAAFPESAPGSRSPCRARAG